MSLSERLKKMGEDLLMLSEDAKKVAAKQDKSIDPKKVPSPKSMQPLTRIYNSKKDIEKSKRNPELYNLIAKTYDIFKG